MTSDAMLRALERGEDFKKRALESTDNLSIGDAALKFNRTKESILDDCESGCLYGLGPISSNELTVYPRWQFEADRERLSAAMKPWRLAPASNWIMHDFMMRPSPHLTGRTPSDWILDGSADINRVIDLATIRLAPDQAAS